MKKKKQMNEFHGNKFREEKKNIKQTRHAPAVKQMFQTHIIESGQNVIGGTYHHNITEFGAQAKYPKRNQFTPRNRWFRERLIV